MKTKELLRIYGWRGQELLMNRNGTAKTAKQWARYAATWLNVRKQQELFEGLEECEVLKNTRKSVFHLPTNLRFGTAISLA